MPGRRIRGGENFQEVTRLRQARAAQRNQDSLYSMSKKVTCPACKKFYFHSKDRAGSMERCLLMGTLGQTGAGFKFTNRMTLGRSASLPEPPFLSLKIVSGCEGYIGVHK